AERDAERDAEDRERRPAARPARVEGEKKPQHAPLYRRGSQGLGARIAVSRAKVELRPMRCNAWLLVALAACALPGCSLVSEPLAAAVAGAGTSAAIGHSLNGMGYRTFTAPLAEVRKATLEALDAMGIKVEAVLDIENGQEIVASAEKRSIYIDLEPISPKATRIKVAAKNGGILYDNATATEIVLQTEKAMFGE